MNKAVKIFTGVLLLCATGLIAYYNFPVYEQHKTEKEKYHYWNELVAKNPKPENVSEEEFIAKNKSGFCWRDKKYYSEKELKDKVMVHFSETFFHYIKLAKEEKLVRDGGDIVQESAYYCKKSDTGCRLWFVPTTKTNQDFKNILLNDHRDAPYYMEYLRGLYAREIPTSDTLADYINLYDSYAIFHNGFEDQRIILGADCCSVLKEKDIRKIPKGIIYGAENYSDESEIPPSIQDVTEYGIGVYYLSVNGFYYNIAQKDYYAEREQDRYQARFHDIRDFYFLSNCGELLFKPYYAQSANDF